MLPRVHVSLRVELIITIYRQFLSTGRRTKMADDETITTVLSSMDDSDAEEYIFPADADEDGHLSAMRLSRLSIETSEGEVADGELSEKDDLDDDDGKDSPPAVLGFRSLPGTPARRRRGRHGKKCGGESESRGKGIVSWLEKAWERRRRREQGIEGDDGECRLLVRRKGTPGCLCMDIDEVRACRELGIELQPRDWTVGFSGSAVDTSSGGNSPIANWRISSPGDDPKDVKARLKMWAQAVALASATSFSG